jgi:hypothetical protein
VRRRDFINGIAGSIAWPLAARSQGGPPVRRIGMLMTVMESDPATQGYINSFQRRLAELIRFWHKPDISIDLADVRFRG